MEYFTRYGLEFNPFLKNSKEILVDTNERRETLFRLDYLAKTKGFGLLTGGAGRGKTTVIRTWAAGCSTSIYTYQKSKSNVTLFLTFLFFLVLN